jgi:hypothetical protein
MSTKPDKGVEPSQEPKKEPPPRAPDNEPKQAVKPPVDAPVAKAPAAEKKVEKPEKSEVSTDKGKAAPAPPPQNPPQLPAVKASESTLPPGDAKKGTAAPVTNPGVAQAPTAANPAPAADKKEIPKQAPSSAEQPAAPADKKEKQAPPIAERPSTAGSQPAAGEKKGVQGEAAAIAAPAAASVNAAPAIDKKEVPKPGAARVEQPSASLLAQAPPASKKEEVKAPAEAKQQKTDPPVSPEKQQPAGKKLESAPLVLGDVVKDVKTKAGKDAGAKSAEESSREVTTEKVTKSNPKPADVAAAKEAPAAGKAAAKKNDIAPQPPSQAEPPTETAKNDEVESSQVEREIRPKLRKSSPDGPLERPKTADADTESGALFQLRYGFQQSLSRLGALDTRDRVKHGIMRG